MDRGTAASAYRVSIEADGLSVGSLWALRAREHGTPNREETRLLEAAALRERLNERYPHAKVIARVTTSNSRSIVVR